MCRVGKMAASIKLAQILQNSHNFHMFLFRISDCLYVNLQTDVNGKKALKMTGCSFKTNTGSLTFTEQTETLTITDSVVSVHKSSLFKKWFVGFFPLLYVITVVGYYCY